MMFDLFGESVEATSRSAALEARHFAPPRSDAFFFDPLRPFSADLIVCDPPWEFQLYSEKGASKSPQAHYDCMPLEAISALPVGHLARGDCWLFLWATAPLLDRSMECLKAWGFQYVSYVVWRKTTKRGKRAVGPGYVVRSLCEIVLIGSIGEPRYAKALFSVFDGVRREHSRKPEEFYDAIDRFAPQAFKVDLFARQRRPGWESFGNQVDKFKTSGEGVSE